MDMVFELKLLCHFQEQLLLFAFLIKCISLGIHSNIALIQSSNILLLNAYLGQALRTYRLLIQIPTLKEPTL